MVASTIRHGKKSSAICAWRIALHTRGALRRVAFIVVWVLLMVSVPPSISFAERSYTVREGDTLARIASRHRVAVRDLSAANGLDRESRLRPGQVLTVPEPGEIYVGSGDTLSSIALRNEVTVSELARHNRIRETATLRLGQRLLMPGVAASAERERTERRWGRPRTPGVVSAIRIGSSQRIRVRFVDDHGRARRAAVRALAPLFRSRRNHRTLEPNRRLVSLMARVSDHFGGRRLQIVSGFRPAAGYTRESSRHTRGHAVDFRVEGVPNAEVRDFCRTLGDVGVGYYPRSIFVHLDTRDEPAYWVDESGPGEAPRYRRGQIASDDTEEGEVEEGLAEIEEDTGLIGEATDGETLEEPLAPDAGSQGVLAPPLE
jgi:uncharacterized protein YcbK (DUF882 family)/LysM repeat protein